MIPDKYYECHICHAQIPRCGCTAEMFGPGHDEEHLTCPNGCSLLPNYWPAEYYDVE